MNKTEFIDYVKSYNKRQGEYTTDECYQIALAYKTLPHREKAGTSTWKWLINNILGIDRTENGFRSWVNERYQKEITEGNKPMFTFTNRQQQLYASKQRLRDELNDYRKLVREHARIDEFREHLCQEIRKIKPLVPKYETLVKSSGGYGIAMFGDLHIGMECNNHYNKYNYNIAVDRVNHWLSNVIYYGKEYKLGTIHFCNGGDLISGIIHRTIRIESEFDLSTQIIKASELVAYAINELSKHFKVVYYSVVDNHSRAIANKDEHIEVESFCKIIDWYVRERLSKNKRVSFPKNNIDDGVVIFELDGKRFAMVHGHHDNKQTALQGLIGMTKQYIDYILMYHYHNSNVHNFQNTRLFINGSFCGTDTYAFNNRLFAEPVQKLLIFEKGNIIDIDINVK